MNKSNTPAQERISRRKFLKPAAIGASAAATPSFLAACAPTAAPTAAVTDDIGRENGGQFALHRRNSWGEISART